MEHYFRHPMNLIISSQTQGGKTEWVLKFCKHDILYPPPKRILWCYTEFQDAYVSDNITFIEGFPDMEDIIAHKHEPQLFIVDDMIDSLTSDSRLFQWFSKGSHHNNLSIIVITQSLFYKNFGTAELMLTIWFY